MKNYKILPQSVETYPKKVNFLDKSPEDKVLINREKFSKNLYLINFPKIISEHWINSLMSTYEQNINIIIDIDKTYKELLKSTKKNVLKEAETLKNEKLQKGEFVEASEIDESIQGLALAYKEEREGNTFSATMTFCIKVIASSEEDLKNIWNDINYELNEIGFSLNIHRNKRGLIDYYHSLLTPSEIVTKYNHYNGLIDVFSKTVPFEKTNLFDSDKRSFFLGTTSQSLPVNLSFFPEKQLLSNRTTHAGIILGKGGSGKSFATKHMILNNYANDVFQIVGDPEGEYTKLFKSSEFNQDQILIFTEKSINPFNILHYNDINEVDWSSQISFVKSFFTLLIFIKNKDLFEMTLSKFYQNHYLNWEKEELILEDYYQFLIKIIDKKSFPGLEENIFSNLEMEDLRQFKVAFSNLLTNSAWLNQKSNITIDPLKHKIVCFDISSLKKEAAQKAIYYLIVNYCDYILNKNHKYNESNILDYEDAIKTLMYFDEGTLLIDEENPQIIEYIGNLYATIRKRLGGVIFIAQNANALEYDNALINKALKQITENTTYYLIFKQSQKSITYLKTILDDNVTESDYNFLLNPSNNNHKGIALLKVGDNQIRLKITSTFNNIIGNTGGH